MRYSNNIEKAVSQLVFATCGRVAEVTNFCDELFYVDYMGDDGKKGIASVRRQGSKLTLINRNIV